MKNVIILVTVMIIVQLLAQLFDQDPINSIDIY